MKKWITILAVLALSLTSLPAAAVSAETSSDAVATAQPRNLYADSAKNLLTISGTTATCWSYAKGISGVTRIEATQYLEKKTLLWWSEVGSWSRTEYDGTLEMTTGRTGLESGTYRLRTVFTVYYGSGTETIEVESESKKVN